MSNDLNSPKDIRFSFTWQFKETFFFHQGRSFYCKCGPPAIQDYNEGFATKYTLADYDGIIEEVYISPGDIVKDKIKIITVKTHDNQEHDLIAPMAGWLSRMFVIQDQKVRAGQVLFAVQELWKSSLIYRDN